MKNLSLIITILALLAGVTLFFATDAIGKQERMNGEIYKSLQLKAGYTETGEPKLFASANPERLARYAAAEGNNIPTETTMVLGAAEAQMMRKEKLFTNVGDGFESFFGIRTTVGGVLKTTNTIIDDMHFLSEQQFSTIQGENDRTFIILTEERMPKLFYTKGTTEETPLTLAFAEGNSDAYTTLERDGKTYQPLVIGSTEAAMMRKEKLFTKTGDTIEGFFGNNVVIVGILKQTGSSLDMMHVSPLRKEDIKA